MNYFSSKYYKKMSSNGHNKDEEFNLSEDLSHDSSFSNNWVENNNFGRGNEMDNSRFNKYSSIHPNINNPQNEKDIFEDDGFNSSLNFCQNISLNLNNTQNEDAKDNNNFIFHPSIGLNSNIPLNENDRNVFSISNNSPIFPSPFGLNTNNPLKENDNFENNIQNDSLINHLNVNNSQIENDSNENKRPNDRFNFGFIENLHVNNSQFENDKYKNEEIKKKKAKVSNRRTKNKFIAYEAEDEARTKETQKRNDYIQKFFKTYFNKFIKNQGNKVIRKSKLPIKFKNLNLLSINRSSFTAITKKSDNYIFLSFTIKEVFTYYKLEKCKGQFRNQKKNKETIEAILKFIDESEDESMYEDVKSFFNMTLEEAYELFYQSEEFKEFQEDERVINNDEEFKVVNGVSLREKYGFIQLIKSHLNEN